MTPEQIAAIQAQIAADLARLQAIVAQIQHQIGNGHQGMRYMTFALMVIGFSGYVILLMR